VKFGVKHFIRLTHEGVDGLFLLIQNALPAQKEGVLRASTGLFVGAGRRFFLGDRCDTLDGFADCRFLDATAGASLLVSCDISTGAATDSSLATTAGGASLGPVPNRRCQNPTCGFFYLSRLRPLYWSKPWRSQLATFLAPDSGATLRLVSGAVLEPFQGHLPDCC